MHIQNPYNLDYDVSHYTINTGVNITSVAIIATAGGNISFLWLLVPPPGGNIILWLLLPPPVAISFLWLLIDTCFRWQYHRP